MQASSIENRAPSIYHEYVGQYVRERRPDAGGSAGECRQGAGVGAAGASAEQVPGCLQPGEWREGGCARPLADFLLHSIDKRENRIRREQEAAHYASPSGDVGGGGSERTGREDAAGERAEEWGEGQEEVGGDGRGSPPSPAQLERLQAEMQRVMCERFLDGGDGEYFDYAAECDDDLELDDLDAMARDAQVLRVRAYVCEEVGRWYPGRRMVGWMDGWVRTWTRGVKPFLSPVTSSVCARTGRLLQRRLGQRRVDGRGHARAQACNAGGGDAAAPSQFAWRPRARVLGRRLRLLTQKLRIPVHGFLLPSRCGRCDSDPQKFRIPVRRFLKNFHRFLKN